jgi:hypothetical protein
MMLKLLNMKRNKKNFKQCLIQLCKEFIKLQVDKKEANSLVDNSLVDNLKDKELKEHLEQHQDLLLMK